ncbi:unnamed protein product [Calypogeia fissa]
MAFASPSRSSPTLDHYLRHGSGIKSSQSQTIYAKVRRKPKKAQSAHFDETIGTWRCKYCSHTYPNPKPNQYERRAHKKICQGVVVKVQRWLSLSTGEETESSQDTSYVVDKPTSQETAEFQSPQLVGREFEFHGTPSSNELPRVSDIQEVGDLKMIISDQDGLVAVEAENSEATEEELDSEPVMEKDLLPGTGDLARLLTLDSDFSLLHELGQDRSKQVDFSGVKSSDLVPVAKGSASGNKEGRDIDREEECEQGLLTIARDGIEDKSGDERKSLQLATGLGDEEASQHPTSMDESGQKLGREVAEGIQSTPSSSDEVGLKNQDAEELGDEDQNAQELNLKVGEGFGETGAILPAVLDDGALREKEEAIGSDEGIITITGNGTEHKNGDEPESFRLARRLGDEEASQSGQKLTTQENTADVLQQIEESQMAATEDPNAQELNLQMDEGFGDNEAILPAGADDEGLREKSGDEQKGSQLARGLGHEEASQHSTPMDQSGDIVHATEEVGNIDGHDETEVVDAISVEPLWEDAEGVTEMTSTTSTTGPPVILSSAQRNWDFWENVVSGEDTSGKDKMPTLPQESEDMTLSQPDNLLDDTADKNAPALEGGSVLTSDRDVGHQIISFQPAGLDWTLAFPDTVIGVVEQPVDPLERSTSTDYHQALRELIPGLDQESKKVGLGLSAAEANWDDWEHVVKRVPTLVEDSTSRKTQDPESSGEYQIHLVDSLGDVSELGQGKTGITVLESEPVVEGGVIDTAAAATDVPVHIPDSENSGWLIDFSQPSVEENNSGTANEEAISGISPSSQQPEVPGTNLMDLLDLNVDSGLEGASSLDNILVPQSETGQSHAVLSKLSSALRNWEDWDHVITECRRLSRPEKTSPVLGSDLADGDHENGLESPSQADSNIVDSGSSSEQAGSENHSETPLVSSAPNREAMNSELDIVDLSQGKQSEGTLTSVPEEEDPLFHSPNTKLEPKVSSKRLPKNLYLLDSGLGPRERTEGVDDYIFTEQEIDGLSQGKQSEGTATSAPEEDDPLFRFPKAELDQKVSSNSLPKNLNVLESGLGTREGTEGLDEEDDPLFGFPTAELEPNVSSYTFPKNLNFLDYSGLGPTEGREGEDENIFTSRYDSIQAVVENLWEDDWEVVDKTEYRPDGIKQSSAFIEDVHDGELSSDLGLPTDLPTAGNLPFGKRRFSDWEDLTKSEYMVLDGPDGESVVFQRTSNGRDELSTNALGRDTFFGL